MKIGLANTSPTLGAIALLLSACGSPDSASTTEAPPSESIESGGARSLEGAPVADDELANDGLANGGLADTGELAGAPLATPVGGSPTLVDKAFLRSCLVNFNSEFSLSLLTGQAWDTFVLSPFYIENCGDNSTWIYTEPRNMNHFHLGFEFESSHPFCQGSPFQVGKNIGGNCTDLKEAKKWPRYAANMQFGSGIHFYARTNDSPEKKLFDLKSIRVMTGPVKVRVYRTDINAWWFWIKQTGTHQFLVNATNLRYLEIYHQNVDGIFQIDDVRVDVHL